MERPVAGSLISAPPRPAAADGYRLELADRRDDAALVRLLADTPLPGAVQVALCREPSFFAAAAVEGPAFQALVVRRLSDGQIVACGSRSVRQRWLRGEPRAVGYLAALRIRPEQRGGTLLARGFRLIRQLHDTSPSVFDITAIAADNRTARRILTSGRGGLPQYHWLDRYLTCVLPTVPLAESRAAATSTGPWQVRPLSESDWPELSAHLDREGRRRPLLPCYTPGDFSGPGATLPGLLPEQIWAAWRGQQIVATLAAWDQTPFKQAVVTGYGRFLSLARPWLNRLARWRRWPTLPAPGQKFPYTTAALALAAPGEEAALEPLLRHVARCAVEQGHQALLIGLARLDPLAAAVRRRALFTYTTDLYAAGWQIPAEDLAAATAGPLYLELGAL